MAARAAGTFGEGMLMAQGVTAIADGEVGMNGGHRLAHVAHVGGAGARAGVGLVRAAPQLAQRSPEAPREREVVAQALIALPLRDLYLHAAGQRRAARATLGDGAHAP